MKKIAFLALLAILTIVSCKKENFQKFTPSSGGFEHKTVSASFTGLIVGADEKGLPDVKVTVGTNTTVTDENGIFFFKNIVVTNSKVYFKAVKSGYFEASRILIAHEGSTHQVRIKMLDNSPIGSFQNNSGGVITLAEAR